jgi:hypothetical protein
LKKAVLCITQNWAARVGSGLFATAWNQRHVQPCPLCSDRYQNDEAAIKKRAALAKGIKASFKTNPDREWRDYIEAEAKNQTLKI